MGQLGRVGRREVGLATEWSGQVGKAQMGWRLNNEGQAGRGQMGWRLNEARGTGGAGGGWGCSLMQEGQVGQAAAAACDRRKRDTWSRSR